MELGEMQAFREEGKGEVVEERLSVLRERQDKGKQRDLWTCGLLVGYKQSETKDNETKK